MKIIPKNEKLKEENYFSNCYRYLTRSKIVHFIFSLIDIILILLQNIDIFNREFIPRYKTNNKIIVNPIILLIHKLDNFPEYIHFLIIFIPIIFFDSFYIFLNIYDIKNNNKLIYIMINLLELFYFRIYSILFYSLLFSLNNNYYFIVSFLFSIHDTYIRVYNFKYIHLYFYVPKFISYPYDELSSRYDLILLIFKIIGSIASTSINEDSFKFLYFFLSILQIYCIYYFINKLFSHSYLFMTNSFLNKTRLSFFFGKSAIIFLSYLLKNKNLFTFLYFVICSDIFLIFLGILYFIYDPFSHIYLNTKTPQKNILFYLNIINKRKDIEILVENQLIKHYKECRLCNLCKRYEKYRKQQIDHSNIDHKENDNENEYLIINKNNKIYDLFNILFDGNKKYFEFIVKVVMNFKKFGKSNFKNNSNYYINLTNLIYSDYKNKNKVLLLNEKIILEIIKNENKNLFENNNVQINQLILYNEYFSLIKKILNLLKEVLQSANNSLKLEKLIILSKLLSKIKHQKYKVYLFNRKFKNITNSKNVLLAYTILYEEILNKTLSHLKIPIRENNQLLEDLYDNSNNNSNITLKFNLSDFHFKIIRVGKELCNYLNYDFYELFPIIFRNHQKKIMINLIFNGFNDKFEKTEENNIEENIFQKKRKFKNEFIQAKLIIVDNISNKSFYKLLNLKFACLFCNQNNNFILFNGIYSINKDTIVTEIDLNYKREVEEEIVGFSNLWVEKFMKKNFFILKHHNSKNINLGHKLIKLFSYKISTKVYNIYNVQTKTTVVMKRRSTIGDVNKFKVMHKSKKNQAKEEEEKEEELENFDNLEEIKKKKKFGNFNARASIQQTNKKRDFFSFDKGKNKKETHGDDYNGMSKTKKSIYFFILFILLIIIIESLYFYRMQKIEYNCNKFFISFKEFFRIYNQLLISILSLACVPEEIDSQKCRNFISIFNELYSKNNPKENFNFTEYLLVQNNILFQKLMIEKSNIIKIRDYLGKKEHTDFFNEEVKYIQISKGNKFSINQINLIFFDEIQIVFNSIRIIIENSNSSLSNPIYFLNKSENPFVNIYNQEEMTNYQEEIYNLILNYKFFSQQIQIVNLQMIKVIKNNSFMTRLITYFFLHLNILLFLIYTLLLYCFLLYFNKLIIEILNLVINSMNKNDDEKDSDFSQIFTKKIKYLEILLEFYKFNLRETIKNLKKLYDKYNEFINKKTEIINPKDTINLLKGTKIEKEKEKENKIEIPKFLSKKDIDKLNINKKYIYTLIIMLFLYIIIYFSFLLVWIDYFLKKNKLNDITEKNSILEKACYDSIIMYELMIFDNYTINELIDYMELRNINGEIIYENTSNIIFNSFYQYLYLLFEATKDIQNLGNLFKYFYFYYSTEYNCFNILTNIEYELLGKISKELPNKNITQKLVNICINSKIAESNDIRTIFERHFQFIKTGMISLNDFSYEGLNKHLNSSLIGRITFFFLSNTIHVIEITTIRLHKESIQLLYTIHNNNFIIMEIVFIALSIATILLNLFFFFNHINEIYKEILLLKKTFVVVEIE